MIWKHGNAPYREILPDIPALQFKPKKTIALEVVFGEFQLIVGGINNRLLKKGISDKKRENLLMEEMIIMTKRI